MRRVSQHDVCYDQLLKRRLPHEEEKEEEEEEKEEGEETTVHSSRYLRSCYCDGWKVVDPVPVVIPDICHFFYTGSIFKFQILDPINQSGKFYTAHGARNNYQVCSYHRTFVTLFLKPLAVLIS